MDNPDSSIDNLEKDNKAEVIYETGLSDVNVKHTESRLFAGYRTLGHVSNHIPCQIRYINLRGENLIVTSTGRNLNTYSSAGLKLLSVSATHDSDITCLTVNKFLVFTAAKHTIFAWRRGYHLQHTYHGHFAEVTTILPFEKYLLSIDIDSNFIMHDVKSEAIQWEIKLPGRFQATCIMHPLTYINKVVIGSRQGTMLLFNVKIAKVICKYNFDKTEITSICQTTGVDIVAVALVSKRISLFHLAENVILFDIKCIDKPISLSFRTDGPQVLIAGSDVGSLTVFSLDSREVISHETTAHQGPIEGVQCFNQEPVFVTSSSDNSLKQWIFDAPDNGYRLLSYRGGHFQPPSRIRFYGPSGINILNSGYDGTFRSFHIYNETYSRCLSKTSLQNSNAMEQTLQKSPIIDFTAESVTNPRHYADVAACHKGLQYVSTWSIANTKRGEKILLHDKNKKLTEKVFPTCVHMTSCGQFVIIGYDNGAVEAFNIQSGKQRKMYGVSGKLAHSGPVRGVAVDRVNSIVVSGSSDCSVKFWLFKSADLVKVFKFSSGLSSMFSQPLGNFACGVFDDGSIVVFDILSVKKFRIFDTKTPVLSACFSPNNRWLTNSTADCIVRTWDLATSSLIDSFRLESMVSSMDYSPNGEFLATALHDCVGILLWMNKTLFCHVSLMPLPHDYQPPSLDSLGNTKESLFTYPTEDEIKDYQSAVQINTNMITLTDYPPSKWKNLLNLDTIKTRNRPKQPPKTYVAPFFLSAMGPGMESEETKSNKNEPSKILQCDLGLSEFATMLINRSQHEQDFEEMCELLSQMSPSRIESEIIGLGPDAGGSTELLYSFMIFINTIIKSNRHFEASQAFLAVFLKVHGVTVQKTDSLLVCLKLIQTSLNKRDAEIQKQVTSVMAYVSYLKSTLFSS